MTKSPGPSASSTDIKVFVLAKNEERNIGRCLRALDQLQLPVAVLVDSSSSDETAAIASGFSFVDVVAYDYQSHCVAYNKICTATDVEAQWRMVLDADMVVTTELFAQTAARILRPQVEVIRAPVLMYAAGQPLRFGSLYPPKPFVFRAGREYFVPVGHGEVLTGDCVVSQTRAQLIHDDRKSFREYLSSQYRYADGLIKRSKGEALTWRDRLRMRTPIMMVVTPSVSLFLKLGILSGRPALIYALDRLLMEVVMFRQSLAEQLRRRSE